MAQGVRASAKKHNQSLPNTQVVSLMMMYDFVISQPTEAVSTPASVTWKTWSKGVAIFSATGAFYGNLCVRN